MSLTQEDLLQIRSVVEEVVQPLQGEIQALRNDVKEIYDMLAKLEMNSVKLDKTFKDLPIKDQILQLNAAVVALALKEGITLPR